MQFETERTAIGELLYRLKNKGDTSVVDEIVGACKSFVERWSPGIDIIVPVPPSTVRNVQPVLLIAEGVSKTLNVPLSNCVAVTRSTKQLKNVYDYDERLRLLEGLYAVEVEAIEGRRVLLFDDLYRSGATMNAVADLLYNQGAKDVFGLTITQTRSNR